MTQEIYVVVTLPSATAYLQIELELRVQGADLHGEGLPALLPAERRHPYSSLRSGSFGIALRE